jgi:hypothetical protein
MLLQLLTEMETQLTASFNGGYLRARFGNTFEILRSAGFLTPSVRAPDYSVDHRGRRRLVVYEGLTAVLVSESDPDDDPITVPVDDVYEWQVDMEAVITAFRSANSLVGHSGALTERLWLAGQLDSVAHVFALLSSPEMALAHLTRLGDLVPGAPTQLYVACPSFEPPPQMRRDFEGRGVSFLAIDDYLKIRGPAATLRNPAKQGVGGRPQGRSAGAMLDCWLVCHGLLRSCGDERQAYDAIHEYYLDQSHHPPVSLPRAGYSRARSYARRARGGRRCQWYQHGVGPPSELLS